MFNFDSIKMSAKANINYIATSCKLAAAGEQWLKDIAFMYINSRLFGDTFTTQQIQQLQYIASLCPYTDGMAVYQARYLLTAFDTIMYDNYCELDINGNGQRLMPTEDEDNILIENSVVKIYPNPANDYIYIERNVNVDLYIEIYNYIGQVIKKLYISKEEVFFSVSTYQMSNGLYLLKLKTNKEEITKRIFINK